MPVEEMALRQYLLSMDPFDFEHHSMSFFQGAGFIKACVTPKSNDFGLDVTFRMLAGHDRFHLDQARRTVEAVIAMRQEAG